MDYLSFKSALALLLESKKELKSLLDSGKVSQEQCDEILDSLPEKLEKYAGWIGRNINNNEASINHIIDLLNWFENNKNKIDEKDINKYTVDSLQSTFDKIGVSKSQIQKEIKSEGAKLIYENNEYLLYEIYNHEASCYYGSGTKWCITGKNPNNPYGGSRAWDGYTKNGAKFMFLIKKNGDINDNYYKVAIAYKDKDNVRYILAAFDALDKQINKSTLKSITKSVGNSWDYTYFENKKWVGYVPFGTMSTEEMLNKVVEGTYTIHSDGTVDVNGNVYMDFNKLTKIPIKFGKVTGYFYCHNNQLTSLEGAPQSVGGSFDCSENQLTSLKGSPKSVGGNFNCMGNKLKSLLDGPELVENNFICNENQLTSLDGAPQSVGDSFICYDNKLTSLKGAPKSVGGDFNCFDNQLTSLKGSPKSVGGNFNCVGNKLKSLLDGPELVENNFICNENQLTSLDGAPQSVGGSFSCWDNQLTSLKGAPQSVGGDFNCFDNQLTSLDGSPQSVGGSFSCWDNQLTSLIGAPKSVGGDFDCKSNRIKFTEDDVRAVSDVKGNIIV